LNRTVGFDTATEGKSFCKDSTNTIAYSTNGFHLEPGTIMEYTLSLALVDFLPVTFTAIGFYFLYRMITHVNAAQGKVAALGALLVVMGGLLKAIWKTIMASTGGATNIIWMDDGLFAWMAPGYVILAWSVWQTVRSVRGQKTFHTWLVPALIAALTLGFAYYLFTSQSDRWNLVLLIVMVLATVVTSVLLIVFAFRSKMTLAGVLFIINIVCVFILSGLARIPEQTIVLQWTEESINTISWLCFAVATKQIFEFAKNNFGVK
jgi:hypothetical protein